MHVFPLSDQFECVISDCADDGVLDLFYGAYDLSFVLANEKEEYGGFVDCLALNTGTRHSELAASHGDFREVVVAARNRATHDVAGGANYLVACGKRNGSTSVSTCASVNLNYIFVVPGYRGTGLAETLLRCVQDQASAFCAPHLSDEPPWLFIEVNDPFRLTVAQYDADTVQAGIDQFQRLNFWRRVGARVLDYEYAQPALSSTQNPDTTLALAVVQPHSNDLSASCLASHLERFFAISVLKGAPLASSIEATRQVQALLAAPAKTLVGQLPLPNAAHWADYRNFPQRRSGHRSLAEALRATN